MRVEPFHICIHCLWMFVVLVFALCQKVKTGFTCHVNNGSIWTPRRSKDLYKRVCSIPLYFTFKQSPNRLTMETNHSFNWKENIFCQISLAD